MNRVMAAFLTIVLATSVFGADVFTAIPDDAAFVAVSRNYKESLEALKGFLDASVPPGAGVPKAAADARIAFFGNVLSARQSVTNLLSDKELAGIAAEQPAAVIGLVWGQGLGGVLLIRGVDTAAWAKAHGWKPAEEPWRGVDTRAGGAKTYFEISKGLLITSNSAETLNAYDAVKAHPLRRERNSALQIALGSSPIVVNISSPTAARVWQVFKKDFCDKAGEAVADNIEPADKGMGAVYIPGTVFGKALSDFVANTDEAYLSIELTPDGLKVWGKANPVTDGVFESILSEQKGTAPAAAQMFSKRPAAVLGTGLSGSVFWAYIRGFKTPFAAGISAESRSSATSLGMLDSIADDFQNTVGLGKTAFVWALRDDWRCPSPILVAEVADGHKAVDSVAGAIKKLYSDALMISYCKTFGFGLKTPTIEKETAGRYGAVVKVPFTMSALDPVKASRIKQFLGDSFVWRVAALELGGRHLVVAGDFSSKQALDTFVATLKPESAPAAPVAASESPIDRGGNAIISLAVDLPQYMAGLVEGPLREGGLEPGRVRLPSTANACELSVAADRDLVRMGLIVPADQIRNSFAAVDAVSSSAAAPAKKEPSACADTPKKGNRGGVFGRATDDEGKNGATTKGRKRKE